MVTYSNRSSTCSFCKTSKSARSAPSGPDRHRRRSVRHTQPTMRAARWLHPTTRCAVSKPGTTSRSELLSHEFDLILTSATGSWRHVFDVDQDHVAAGPVPDSCVRHIPILSTITRTRQCLRVHNCLLCCAYTQIRPRAVVPRHLSCSCGTAWAVGRNQRVRCDGLTPSDLRQTQCSKTEHSQPASGRLAVPVSG